jgi:transposase
MGNRSHITHLSGFSVTASNNFIVLILSHNFVAAHPALYIAYLSSVKLCLHFHLLPWLFVLPLATPMKQLSPETRNLIINGLKNGLPATKTATMYAVSRSSVNNIRKVHLPTIQKSRGGRPQKLTVREKRKLVRLITSGEVDTAVEAQRQLTGDTGKAVHPDTIRNVLKEEGMRSFVKPKKPLLAKRHVRQRLAFARKYQYWTVDDWKRVVWSDETKINRFGSDGRKWGWKKLGAQLKSQHVQPTVKHGGGSLMIWGCMTAEGVGYMCRIDGRMDAKLYTDILNDYLLQTVEYYGIDRESFVFQQDNDSKHTSKLAKKWIEEHDIEVLDWPAQSPDLNPIEHLWDHLKMKLSDYDEVPTSMHELWRRVEAEWEKIAKDECVKLIESMPRRIGSVLKANGGYTKY